MEEIEKYEADIEGLKKEIDHSREQEDHYKD